MQSVGLPDFRIGERGGRPLYRRLWRTVADRTFSSEFSPMAARFRSFSWSSRARSSIPAYRETAKARRLILTRSESVSNQRNRSNDDPHDVRCTRELQIEDDKQYAHPIKSFMIKRLRAECAYITPTTLVQLRIHSSRSPARRIAT